MSASTTPTAAASPPESASGPGRRLHVLHLGRFPLDAGFGGIERHVDNLLRGLAGAVDADNLVAARTRQGEIEQGPGYRVIRARFFGLVAGTALSPALIGWARRLHRQRPYDLVHLHFPDPLSQLVAQCLPRRVKRVITWHSDIIRQHRLLRLYRPFLDRFLADADAVIAATPAHFAASTQMGAVPSARRHVIPYGLDYGPFDAPDLPARAAQLRQRLCGDAPLVFAVGRHVYYKGFEHLIAAMAELAGVHLALGGTGPLTPALRTQAQAAGLRARVHFLGHIPEIDLPAWHQAADIFCLPSVAPAEAFGLAQLEAMACGKPVVCCQLGNGVNVVNPDGVTGLAVPPGDARALAAALQRLFRNEDLRRRLGTTARARARREYSQQAMATATLELYRQLAG